jgi:hypothetical protein
MATEELTILCGNVGWKWDDVWVRRLQGMVGRYCREPYRFLCVSDHHIDGVDTISPSRDIDLDSDKPQGCWVKLDYFKREVSGDGPCIALDLDVTIVGDLSSLKRDTLHGVQDPRNPWEVPYLNSSVLSWTPSKETDKIYVAKIPYEEYPRGDQEYIADHYPAYKILPDCYSYKGHVKGSKDVLPDNAKVIFFHGMPTPASKYPLTHLWNAQSWKGLTPIERL